MPRVKRPTSKKRKREFVCRPKILVRDKNCRTTRVFETLCSPVLRSSKEKPFPEPSFSPRAADLYLFSRWKERIALYSQKADRAILYLHLLDFPHSCFTALRCSLDPRKVFFLLPLIVWIIDDLITLRAKVLTAKNCMFHAGQVIRSTEQRVWRETMGRGTRSDSPPGKVKRHAFGYG